MSDLLSSGFMSKCDSGGKTVRLSFTISTANGFEGLVGRQLAGVSATSAFRGVLGVDTPFFSETLEARNSAARWARCTFSSRSLGNGRLHCLKTSAASSAYTGSRFSSLLRFVSQRRPRHVCEVKTLSTRGTASGSGPLASPASNGPLCNGKGKKLSYIFVEPPWSSSSWCSAKSLAMTFTLLRMFIFCFCRSVSKPVAADAMRLSMVLRLMI
mmetsp:Transcript_39253/g.108151  ORF Transcript_39253/g.108151 Transcript_39253/m.108151 type:complete len:213 (+) Transcript_39253:342-980(+)